MKVWPSAMDVGTVLRDLRSDGRGWILLFIAGGWFFSLGVRLTFPPLLPYIRAELGMSLTGAGLLITALWLAYALGQFPGGMFRDRIGDRNVLVVSTAVSAVTLLGIARASTVATLFAATMLFGFGTALFGTARFTVLADTYERRDGVAIGLTMAAGNAGNVVLPVCGALIATYAAWRVGFGLAAPFFLVFAVGLWWAIPGKAVGSTSAVDTLSVEALRRVFVGVARRPVLVMTGVVLLIHFTWQGFTGFYPTYLVERKGLAPNTAAGLYGLFFALGIVVQPLAGAGSDRFGARPVLLGAISMTVLTLGSLPFVDGLGPLIVFTALSSAVLGVVPVANAYLVAALPTDVQGSGLGLMRTVYITCGSAGPVIVGAVADGGYFDWAFPLLAAVSAGAILLCLSLPPREP